MKVLVIDSEGIGGLDEDENHDTRIFLLALLLSSNFIFNSMNTIDENAISTLSLIVNLSKQLQVRESESLGDCDAFISHSWHDSGEQKWAMLSEWAAAFGQVSQRVPLLWLECV